MSGPVRVLYIAGWGRSGSTLLNRVLGEVPGFFPAGELRFLWQRNLAEGHACGCGSPFRDCPVWAGVVARASLDDGAGEVRRALDLAVDDRRIPALGRAAGPGRAVEELGPVADRIVRLYRAIRDETGCRVVVDASKVPTYGRLIEALPGLDVRVLHLVRDARAVAYSWLRRKMQDDVGRPMIQRSAFESGWRWAVRNAEVGWLWRNAPRRPLVLQYEAWIARPEESLARIVALAGEAAAPLPFVRPGVVALGPAHTCSGNPDRFRTGETPLRHDDAWRQGLSRGDRWLVNSLTWPLMRAYGYLPGSRA